MNGSTSTALAEAIDHRAGLLESVAEAEQAKWHATLYGTPDDRYAAGWGVTEAIANVDELDGRIADAVLIGLHLLARRYPPILAGIMRDALEAGMTPICRQVNELAERMTDAEAAIVAIAEGRA